MVGRSEDSALVAVLGVPLEEELNLLSNLQQIKWRGWIRSIVSLSQLHYIHQIPFP